MIESSRLRDALYSKCFLYGFAGLVYHIVFSAILLAIFVSVNLLLHQQTVTEVAKPTPRTMIPLKEVWKIRGFENRKILLNLRMDDDDEIVFVQIKIVGEEKSEAHIITLTMIEFQWLSAVVESNATIDDSGEEVASYDESILNARRKLSVKYNPANMTIAVTLDKHSDDVFPIWEKRGSVQLNLDEIKTITSYYNQVAENIRQHIDP